MTLTSSRAVWYAMRASGVVSLVLLTVVMVLGLLTAGRARTKQVPAIVPAELHKRVTVMTMIFLAIHVATAVLDTYVHVGIWSAIVPFVSGYRALWTGLGTVALDLLLAVGISSALRQRINPSLWRTLHWLAYLCWPVAVIHVLGIGTDVSQLWMEVLVAVCTGAVVLALAWRWLRQQSVENRKVDLGARTYIGRPAGPVSSERPTPVRSGIGLLEKEQR